MTQAAAAEALAAVLGEAGPSRWLGLGARWNELVSQGLRVLGGEWVAGGYAPAWRGAEGYRVGQEVRFSGAVAGYAGEPPAGWPGTVFVISGAVAMRAEELPGVVEENRVVFPPGIRLRVSDITEGPGGQRRIWLVPAEIYQMDERSRADAGRASPAVARWRTAMQQLDLASLLDPAPLLDLAPQRELEPQLVALLEDAENAWIILYDEHDEFLPWVEVLMRRELRWLAGIRGGNVYVLAMLTGLDPQKVEEWLRGGPGAGVAAAGGGHGPPAGAG